METLNICHINIRSLTLWQFLDLARPLGIVLTLWRHDSDQQREKYHQLCTFLSGVSEKIKRINMFQSLKIRDVMVWVR